MNSLPEDIMKKLQEDYLVSFVQKIETMREAHARGDTLSVRQVFHKLAGTGATYLMPEITTLGRAAEDYIEKTKSVDSGLLLKAIDLMGEIYKKRSLGSELKIEKHPLITELTARK